MRPRHASADARRTRKLARAGASAHAIRLLAGHATLQQSLAYVHLTETDVVHAVRLLDRPSVAKAAPAGPLRRVGG